MKPLLVFDLDGTLIDSAHDIATALNAVLTKYQKPALPHPLIVDHIGEGLRKLLTDFFPEQKEDSVFQSQIETEFLTHYEEVMFENTAVFPGVQKFLESWPGQIGIITNKNEMPARVLLKHLQLHHFPWVQIFGADTWPEKKPSPLPLHKMMELAQVSPAQTVMIGDGKPDILSAKAAGVKSIAIEFGYTQPHILKELGAHTSLPHYDNLHHVIKSLGL